MLLERAEISVKDGLEDEFAATMKDRALPMLAGTPGVIWTSVGRGVENPDKFLLLVAWETLEAHTAFTKAAHFPEFRGLLTPFPKAGRWSISKWARRCEVREDSSFSEEKEAKRLLRRCRGSFRREPRQRHKSLLALFFRKERLSILRDSRSPSETQR